VAFLNVGGLFDLDLDVVDGFGYVGKLSLPGGGLLPASQSGGNVDEPAPRKRRVKVADSFERRRRGSTSFSVVPRHRPPGTGQTNAMSDLTNTTNQLSVTSAVTSTTRARLSLKPDGFPAGAFDGAWWPRSTDPAIELTALTDTLEAQRAPVRRISLIMAGWDSAPHRIRLDSGRKVAVDWFRNGDMRIIRVVDTNDQRLDLLITPVDTDQAIAHRALTMATNGQDPDITATVGHHSAPEEIHVPPISDVAAISRVATTPDGTHRAQRPPIASMLANRRPHATAYGVSRLWGEGRGVKSHQVDQPRLRVPEVGHGP
jgi:hypothetical protein